MEYRTLGRTGLRVSAICLGTGFRGGLEEATCRATIDRAVDGGVNFIDCANIYRGGLAEKVLGEAMKGRRQQLIITTKVGSPTSEALLDRGLSRVHIMRQIEESLRRLQTDYVDLYLVHQRDILTPIDVTLRALDDLVHSGKVRYVGCCNFAAWEVCKGLWASDKLLLSPFACVQQLYNLLDRSAEGELMPLVRSEGLGMMVYSPLAIGLLTGRFRHGAPPPADTPWGQGRARFPDSMSPEADRVVQELTRIGLERGKAPAQVAIAWVLSHPEVTAAIMGPDRPEHVEENLGGTDWSLTPEERQALDAVSAWAMGRPAPL